MPIIIFSVIGLPVGVEVWIVSHLVFHRSAPSVTRKYYRVGGKCLRDVLQALHYIVEIAEFKVGAPDAHLEQCVAGESKLFFFTIKENGAGSMSGGAYNAESMVAESNFFPVADVLSNFWKVISAVNTDECLGLLSKPVHQRLVGFAYFRMQAERVKNELVAEVVVYVSVRTKQVLGSQIVITYIIGNGFFLFIEKSTTVDYYAFASFVADYIAVLLEHVADEPLDFHIAEVSFYRCYYMYVQSGK
jgi:hypothetical protein